MSEILDGIVQAKPTVTSFQAFSGAQLVFYQDAGVTQVMEVGQDAPNADAFLLDDFVGEAISTIWATSIVGAGSAALVDNGVEGGWVRLLTGNLAGNRSVLEMLGLAPLRTTLCYMKLRFRLASVQDGNVLHAPLVMGLRDQESDWADQFSVPGNHLVFTVNGDGEVDFFINGTGASMRGPFDLVAGQIVEGTALVTPHYVVVSLEGTSGISGHFKTTFTLKDASLGGIYPIPAPTVKLFPSLAVKTYGGGSVQSDVDYFEAVQTRPAF